MVILGVDPGTEFLGLACIEVTEAGERLLWTSCLVRPKRQAIGQFLAVAANALKLTRRAEPVWSVVGCEDVFVGRFVKAGLKLAEVVGVVRTVAAIHKAEFRLIPASSWRHAVTGIGTASYVFVLERLRERFPDAGLDDVTEHELAAVGVAIAAARPEQLKLFPREKRGQVRRR